jgi:hypothetical protein
MAWQRGGQDGPFGVGWYVFLVSVANATLCRRSRSLWKGDAMEIPMIHLTRQEVEDAALELGAKLRTIQHRTLVNRRMLLLVSI